MENFSGLCVRLPVFAALTWSEALVRLLESVMRCRLCDCWGCEWTKACLMRKALFEDDTKGFERGGESPPLLIRAFFSSH